LEGFNAIQYNLLKIRSWLTIFGATLYIACGFYAEGRFHVLRRFYVP